MGVEIVPPIEVAAKVRPWWESRTCLSLVVLATMLPLLYPQVPPLVDLLGHMGRYRVELDLDRSPWLQQYYDYHWAAIGNLGVDLLVIPLGKLFGLELAVKLIVLAIPPMTAAGFLWVAREVHGRVPPTAFFAVPFIYGYPFLFGFVNFTLSVALAFLTYVWLRLTIAAVAMWGYVYFRGEKLGLPRSAWGSILLLALLNNVLPFTLFGWGQTHIASGLASILNATTPIWGVVVAHFLTHDERMTPRKIAGVLLGFGGVATMIGPSLLSSLGSSALAQLACVTASLSYALAAVWARRFRRQGISPLSVTTGQLTAGALMMLPMSMFIDRPWTHGMPPITAWGAIAALALFCTALGYVLYFRLIATSGATNALLVTLLVPPVAIVLGAAFLNETLAPQDFIGLGLIALGLAAIDGRLISFVSVRRRLPKEA